MGVLVLDCSNTSLEEVLVLDCSNTSLEEVLEYSNTYQKLVLAQLF